MPQSSSESLLQQKFHQAPLYAILDTALRADLAPAALAGALLRAGVRVIQYRHKASFRRVNFDECCALAELVHTAGGVFIVNDRADVAALCQADGVHLGQEDLPPEKARQFLGPAAADAKIIGYSTHNRVQAELAARLPVDYIAIGPVFPTKTKQHPDPVVGLAMVAEIRGLTAKPLVAIGGITLENAPSVLQAGADAVAVASDLLRDSNIERRVGEFLSSLYRGGSK
ncbi:MAG: thiamine phosphate synthase [Acidobacteria bacterium]|nr:thiamine phosphate synthase [Acidobacteriota bacterium]